mgnify:CR=1 FL=1
MSQKILYLHGFHSSPWSEKALIFKQAVAESGLELEVIAPQLAVYPEAAIAQVETCCRDNASDVIGVVGSSLGGYLATYLHNRLLLPIVVINPAVKPFELLADYIGPQIQPITEQAYELTEAHMEQLKSIYSPELEKPERVWLLQQEGDEVLDYRQAVAHYQNCKVALEPKGNHSFVGFDRFGTAIIDFLLSASRRH